MLRAPLRSTVASHKRFQAAMEHTTTAKSRETAAVHNFFGNIGMRGAKRRCWNGELDWTARKIGHYRDAINPFVREFRFFLSEKKRETEREGGEEREK